MGPGGVLFLSLLLPSAAPAVVVPPLAVQRGDEWTYRGTVSEAINRIDVRFQRKHELEVRVLVLETRRTSSDLAVLTLLRRVDDTVSNVVPVVSGTFDRTPSPPATRLDFVRILADGTARMLTPGASVVFATDHPITLLPDVSLDSFVPFEFGMFPPRPKEALEPGRTWTIAPAGRVMPAQECVALPEEFVAGERCVPVRMTRQTPNWAKPVSGQTAWQHLETAWHSTRDGTIRRVHRIIHQRDGLKVDPAVAIEVKFDLDDQTQLYGREFERGQREIATANHYAHQLAYLLPHAVKIGSHPFEYRIAQLDEYLRNNPPVVPYREAVQSIRRRLDAARKGETAIVLPLAKVGAGVTASPVEPSVARGAVAP